MAANNNQLGVHTSLKRVLSEKRLRPYFQLSNTTTEALSLYVWNIALSESLYPSLQTLEIALRNSINQSISSFYHCENWLENPTILYLHERKKVENAKEKLSRNHKICNIDQVICELSFGFWTSLFDLRYEQKLWPKLLKTCFPYIPARLRTRKQISSRLNKIRLLRNRIYHYEPIWHWQDLKEKHKELVEVLSSLEPNLCKFNAMLDRFEQIYKTGANYVDHFEI